MNDISGISTHRLSSQPKVSLESAQQQPQIEVSKEIEEMRHFESEMEQINHAFVLMKEIRLTLESALRDLSPNN